MRKKVIADKEAQKYKIIHYSFKVNHKRRVGNLQFILQIFTKHPNVKKLWIPRISLKLKKKGKMKIQISMLDSNPLTWYFFLWIGQSSAVLPSSVLVSGLPWQSAAKWPTWPHTKHLSCCPGKVITCPSSN
jgi:hypothetical protein